jgi:hypothetical protein
MKEEKEIKAHVEYLMDSINKTDVKQLRELNIRLSELLWVLDKPNQKE